MTDILIEGGQTLIGNGFVDDATLHIADGLISETSSRAEPASLRIDSKGLIALPGIVDMHGDAFERQMMPRPGVDFPIDVALIDSDRQAIANGMTTVFHRRDVVVGAGPARHRESLIVSSMRSRSCVRALLPTRVSICGRKPSTSMPNR